MKGMKLKSIKPETENTFNHFNVRVRKSVPFAVIPFIPVDKPLVFGKSKF